jgi:hypothetical protein
MLMDKEIVQVYVFQWYHVTSAVYKPQVHVVAFDCQEMAGGVSCTDIHKREIQTTSTCALERDVSGVVRKRMSRRLNMIQSSKATSRVSSKTNLT